MRNIVMEISYDGTRFAGFQNQKNNKNTIQYHLEDAILRALGEKADSIASGRTDAGVHAIMQVSNFHTASTLSPDEIKNALNTALPADIAINKARETDDRFHSRFHAKSKTYLYRIHNTKVVDPFTRKYTLHEPRELDLPSMKAALMLFEGRHDFSAFTSSKSDKSAVRNIFRTDVQRRGNELEIRVTADGFLYNMVRIIVGTVIEIGLHEKSYDIKAVLEGKKRADAGHTVLPHGLFLEKVEY